ncbi:PAC2 family protein [Candidatus Hodarchaeum mangrovi]
MYLETLTDEIEDWIEKAEETENLRLIYKGETNHLKGAIAIELLGYYGSVDKLITKELLKVSQKSQKIAGFFSNYFNEMIEFSLGEILLPISVLSLNIGNQPYILTTTNFAIPDIICYRLSEELFSFYQQLNVSKILLIDGVYSRHRSLHQLPKVHRIISNDFKIHMISKEKSNFSMMGQIASSFLTYRSQIPNIPLEIVAVESFAEYDPISAYELLKFLNQEFNIDNGLEYIKELADDYKREINAIYEEEKEEENPEKFFFT